MTVFVDPWTIASFSIKIKVPNKGTATTATKREILSCGGSESMCDIQIHQHQFTLSNEHPSFS